MKRFLLASFVLLAACSGADGEISIEASGSPLTAQGGDKLFTIKLVEARDGGYLLSGLVAKVVLEDKGPIVVTCAPGDTNGNGSLDKDETLVCTEPETNQFGADLAGQEIDVELFAKIDDEETEVGTATWKP